MRWPGSGGGWGCAGRRCRLPCTTATSCSPASVPRRDRVTSCSSAGPTRPGQLSVKRAVRPDGDGWWVLGDNPFGSTDSSTLGPAQVRAVVRGRLWPRPGRLRG